MIVQCAYVSAYILSKVLGLEFDNRLMPYCGRF